MGLTVQLYHGGKYSGGKSTILVQIKWLFISFPHLHHVSIP